MAISLRKIDNIGPSESCSICLTEMNPRSPLVGHTQIQRGGAVVSHVFHQACISQALVQREECPLCRSAVINAVLYLPPSGKTLIFAVQQGSLDRVTAILGSQVEIEEKDYITALVRAVRTYQLDIAKQLLSSSLPISSERFGPIIIEIATIGNLEMLQEFLKKKIPISERTYVLAINAANRNQHFQMAKKLYTLINPNLYYPLPALLAAGIVCGIVILYHRINF